MNKTATLVVDSEAQAVRTAYCEVDSRTALTRGLADYLATISGTVPGGRELRFAAVFDTWAEAEKSAVYPAALARSEGPGMYDASRFVPGISERDKIDANNYLLQISEYTMYVVVELWSTDIAARLGLVKMCEDAFNPVDFMYGFKLELPFYYGLRATYALKSSIYSDSEETAIQRYRQATFTLEGQVPVVRLVTYPDATPRLRLDEVGPNVIVRGSV